MDVVDLTEQGESSSSTSASTSHQNSSSRSKSRLENSDDDVVEIVIPLSPRREKVSKKRQKRSWESAKSASINIITVLDDDSDDDDVEIIDIDGRFDASKQRREPPTIIPANNTPMNRILELFPDIKRSHVYAILGRVGMLDSEINVPIATEFDFDIQEGRISTAIQNLVENGMTYPKEEVRQENVIPMTTAVASSSQRYRYDYSAPSAEYERNYQYSQECSNHLLNEMFPFMTKVGLKWYLNHCKGRYYLCYTMLCDKIMAKDEKNDDGSISKEEQEEINLQQLKLILLYKQPRSLTPRQKLSLRIPSLPNQSVVLSARRGRVKGPDGIPIPGKITAPILLEEINFTNEKFKEWSQPIEQRRLRRMARKVSEREGTTIECQCCYGDCAWEEMVSCREEGHLFCIDCVRRYAEERVFGFGDLGKGNGGVGNKKGGAREIVELTCMHGDGCTSAFTYDQLTKALPPKIMKKYDELQATLVVEKAGMKDLCKCPHCDFAAMLPETEMLFNCPNCRIVTCRKCGEPPHIPLRCEEVEKKGETNARLRIEEAMTKARVRSCPNCAKKFYKVEGCNKMCCPSCQTKICYVCRKRIDSHVGYKHFCQTPHCNHKSCNKCPLYSKSEEDDLRAAREAGLKTAEMLNVRQLEDDTVGGDGPQSIRLDLEKILENPTL